MPTNYPTSLDDGTSLPTKVDGDTITSAEDNTTNNAVKALEAKVGITSSAVTTSLDYKIARIRATAEIASKQVSGSFASSIARNGHMTGNTGFANAQVTAAAVYLAVGDVVTGVAFASAGTAFTRGTTGGSSHVWGALWNPSLALMAQSTDDTSATWAASTRKTFTLATSQTITVSGLHYVGVMVNMGTGGAPVLPNLSTAGAAWFGFDIAPQLAAIDYVATGLTTTAPSTLTLTAGVISGIPYADVVGTAAS